MNKQYTVDSNELMSIWLLKLDTQLLDATSVHMKNWSEACCEEMSTNSV